MPAHQRSQATTPPPYTLRRAGVPPRGRSRPRREGRRRRAGDVGRRRGREGREQGLAREDRRLRVAASGQAAGRRRRDAGGGGGGGGGSAPGRRADRPRARGGRRDRVAPDEPPAALRPLARVSAPCGSRRPRCWREGLSRESPLPATTTTTTTTDFVSLDAANSRSLALSLSLARAAPPPAPLKNASAGALVRKRP